MPGHSRRSSMIAPPRGQQTVDDLQLALLAVAIVAEPGELAAASLQVARRHVVEHQRAVAQMLAGDGVGWVECWIWTITSSIGGRGPGFSRMKKSPVLVSVRPLPSWVPVRLE